MPVSKDTTANKKDTDLSILFPYQLVGKKLIRTDPSSDRINNEHELFLENFLRLKDAREFVNAVKSNNVLLGYFLFKKFKPKGMLQESEIYVDSIRVVYETLSWWIQLHQCLGEKDESDIAKKFLYKIAPVLILEREEVLETPVKDGLIHITRKIKGHHPSLEYDSAEKFIQRWEEVYKAFKESRSKKRYGMYDRETKQDDALKAISRLGNELLDDEVDLLDLTNTRTKTASYIRAVHVTVCPICRKNNRNKKYELSDKTIINLLNKALKEKPKKLKK